MLYQEFKNGPSKTDLASAAVASRKCDVSENDTRRGTCPLSNTFIRDDDTYATDRPGDI